ncbi:eukaryotic translation initiation factor 3 subunit 7, putative [Bodo saltans]|uniref:Eukaryotic translation initiation factor 3 subunit 7, putative n=1 Tax=Bodo saltans TaxID=75058 RepID=A0A0S4IWX5_BODSA|nr:eukaryotic translation initiation factor 3 subunit 7, putative [Bodo saltans]|eukprot:CUF83293.1 eukaryotic translation initiation factor 3 subunit 7, putative [Bodo saltans]
MTFVLPELHSSTPSTWGPPPGEDELAGMRVSLIDKSDFKWCGIEDWTAKTTLRQKTTAVDNNRAAVFVQKKMGRGNTRGGRGGARGGSRGAANGGRGGVYAGRGGNASRGGRGGRGGRKSNRKPRARLEDILYSAASMRKKDESSVIGNFDQDDLSKMTAFTIPASSDIKVCGLPRQYNDKVEQTRTSASKPLLETPGENPTNFSRVSAQEDPELREIIKSIEGTCPLVITTDEVLSTLMASSRSVHSWHIQFFRFRRFVFINKPEHGRIEEEWVAENNTEDGPTESDPQVEDRITSMARESTAASRYFRRQSQLKSVAKGFQTSKNPFEKTTSMFKYRRYNIGEKAEKYVLLVRSEIDAVQNDQQLRIFGLLEHLPSQKDKLWTRALDTSRATVLVNEVKVNKFKFTRWIAQSVLAGANLMKIGFISRILEPRSITKKKGDSDQVTTELKSVPRIYPVKKDESVVKVKKDDSASKKDDDASAADNHIHAVVGVETTEPIHFATQTGVSIANLWAIANLYITKFIAYSNDQLGYVVNADGEMTKTDSSAPKPLTAFLMKHVNERRLEMFEQDEDEDDEEDEEEEDEEEEDEEGSDEEEGDE